MHDSFLTYSHNYIRSVSRALVNLAIFFPYYFSVPQLAKTLLAPWKNTTSRLSTSSWSIQVLSQRLAENTASRLVGFMVRSSILIAFLFIQVGFVLSIPAIIVGTLAALPISYVIYTIMPSKKELRDKAYNAFMARHMADMKNQQKVSEWFEVYYRNSIRAPWWTLERLMSIPPLGRDLTFGFTNTLDAFSEELSQQKPHYKHLIGRTREINYIQNILSKSGRANVLLMGEEGVGKSAIIEAVAKAIYEGSITQNLAYKRVLHVDLDKALAQSTDAVKRGDTISQLFEEAEKAGNIIIVIHDIHRYIGSEDGHIDLAAVIAKHAASSSIHFLATTTPRAYQKYIFPHQEVDALFERMDLEGITAAQTLNVLMDVATDIEARHNVHIVYSALEEAVTSADRHMASQPFPEKAIELLDEACVFVKSAGSHQAVDAHIIRTVVERRTHVPTELNAGLKDKLLHLEDKIRTRVLFQDQAIQALGTVLRKSFTMLLARRKPLASMLFLGPTGVGKTETAKALTGILFDSEDAMLRFDMANFQRISDIPRLIGSPDTNEPGLLTEAIRNQTYGTLLLDELDKAHTDLLNIFLTILDEGYFTDGFGKRVDCTHLIIIATSNAGAEFIYKSFTDGTADTDISRTLLDHLIAAGTYSPEFLNRFDGVVVYKPLYKEAIKEIAQKLLSQIATNVHSAHGATIEFTPGFIDEIIQSGYDIRFGARNMQRVIRDRVEDQLSKMILSGSIQGKVIRF